MIDQTLVLLSVAGLVGLAMAAVAMLAGWRGWLDLKRLEIAGRASGDNAPSSGSRIELADLRERVRKLEGIAAGVDL